MAELVLAVGSSHAPTLNSTAAEIPQHGEIDKGTDHWRRSLVDKDGAPTTYEALLDRADDAIAAQIAPDVVAARVERCAAGIARVAACIAEAELDALIVVGDDQHEQFRNDNMPAILVYWGATIRNNVLQLGVDAPEFWKRARSQFHEPAEGRDYPVAADFGRHLIEHLIEAEFDVSHATELGRPHGEGHAFGFVHRRLMADRVVPILPIMMNTYFPPNQPRPRRCYALGRAIAAAVSGWQGGGRVGILASGGLSHFVVDEALDIGVLDACRDKQADALSSIPTNKLNSGSSEIRNWIVTAGAAEHLDTKWQDYIPFYRSPAGTGTGIAFAVWS